MRIPVMMAVAATLSGCAALPSKPVFLTGPWGGQGVGLLIEGGIAQVQFDCAAGTIDSNLAASGTFSAPGTYRTGAAGPVRVGQIFTSQRATYSGSVAAETMTLSVRLEDGTSLGPFTLTRGAQGQINRCL